MGHQQQSDEVADFIRSLREKAQERQRRSSDVETNLQSASLRLAEHHRLISNNGGTVVERLQRPALAPVGQEDRSRSARERAAQRMRSIMDQLSAHVPEALDNNIAEAQEACEPIVSECAAVEPCPAEYSDYVETETIESSFEEHEGLPVLASLAECELATEPVAAETYQDYDDAELALAASEPWFREEAHFANELDPRQADRSLQDLASPFVAPCDEDLDVDIPSAVEYAVDNLEEVVDPVPLASEIIEAEPIAAAAHLPLNNLNESISFDSSEIEDSWEEWVGGSSHSSSGTSKRTRLMVTKQFEPQVAKPQEAAVADAVEEPAQSSAETSEIAPLPLKKHKASSKKAAAAAEAAAVKLPELDEDVMQSLGGSPYESKQAAKGKPLPKYAVQAAIEMEEDLLETAEELDDAVSPKIRVTMTRSKKRSFWPFGSK